MEKYVVQIIEYDTGEVVKQFKPEGKRSAERIERGVNINLNHDKFYTVVEPEHVVEGVHGDE